LSSFNKQTFELNNEPKESFTYEDKARIRFAYVILVLANTKFTV